MLVKFEDPYIGVAAGIIIVLVAALYYLHLYCCINNFAFAGAVMLLLFIYVLRYICD